MADFLGAILILVPAGLWVGSIATDFFSRRSQAAALLATIGHAVAALAIYAIVTNGTGALVTDGEPRFLQVLLNLVLGQAILFGAVLHLFGKRLGLPGRTLAGLIGLLLLSFSPLVSGGDLIRLATALLIWSMATVPTLLLAAWTDVRDSIVARSLMQNTIWAAILLWLMPGAVIANGLGQWSTPDQLQDWPRVVSIAALLLPIGLISVALGEFAVRGNGTGFPFDPPEKLVTTGVYALVSNPMQLGICSMMAVWGLVLQNPLITAMAGVAFFLFVVFKNVCNGSFAIGRRDPEWCSYQDAVPR